MSAAVNDRPLGVLSSRPHLPLTGELHPLRREFERLLAMGNVVALTFALLACSIIYFWPRSEAGPIDLGSLVKPDGVTVSPPPIDPGRNAVGVEAVGPIVGEVIYEPAEDVNVSNEDPGVSGGGNGEGDPGGDVGPYSGSWGEFDSTLIPEPPAQPSQAPVMWDDPPVLISIEPSDYPRMVRDAGIDGTVWVRVLVGVNGRVKDAYVVDGSQALRESALETARTAVFKPALVGVHPVEVWVVIPITFQLRARY